MNLFDISKIDEELKVLEKQTMNPEFWNDSKNSKLVLQKIKKLKSKKDTFEKIRKELINLEEMNELLLLEDDETLSKELLNSSKKIDKDIEKLEIATLLSGKYDSNNAIITLHPGARRNRISRLGGNAL